MKVYPENCRCRVEPNFEEYPSLRTPPGPDKSDKVTVGLFLQVDKGLARCLVARGLENVLASLKHYLQAKLLQRWPSIEFASVNEVHSKPSYGLQRKGVGMYQLSTHCVVVKQSWEYVRDRNLCDFNDVCFLQSESPDWLQFEKQLIPRSLKACRISPTLADLIHHQTQDPTYAFQCALQLQSIPNGHLAALNWMNESKSRREGWLALH
jgi:hypothetical protein